MPRGLQMPGRGSFRRKHRVLGAMSQDQQVSVTGLVAIPHSILSTTYRLLPPWWHTFEPPPLHVKNSGHRALFWQFCSIVGPWGAEFYAEKL